MGSDLCDTICRRYEEGETAESIARDFQVSRNAVLNLVRSEAITVRLAAPSPDHIAWASSLYEAGNPIASIADELGFSYGAVRRALIKAGVQMRPRGFQPKATR